MCYKNRLGSENVICKCNITCKCPELGCERSAAVLRESRGREQREREMWRVREAAEDSNGKGCRAN